MRILPLSSTLPAACVALALCASPAFAGDDSAKPKHQGEHHQKVLEKFDSNHDGKLDETERAAARAACSARIKDQHPELFAKLDTDHDQALSREELRAGREKIQKLRQEKRPDPAAASARLKEKHPEIFKQLDTDNDGQLSKAELQAGREKLRELREKHGDQPGDKPGKGE